MNKRRPSMKLLSVTGHVPVVTERRRRLEAPL